MNWKHLLESASESVNADLRRRNAYLVAENRILRNQIDGRVQLTDSERKELAEIGAKLGKKVLEEIATVAQPATILAWNRKFADQKVETSAPRKSVGRPRVDQEIEDWAIRVARENRSWGYDRIQGALKHLGYTISDQTVGNILKRHNIPPAPERKKTVTWREFTRCHFDVLLATDFFNSDVWNWLGLLVSYLLTMLHRGRHHVQVARRTLDQPLLAMRALMRLSLALSPDGPRSTPSITERSPVKRFDGKIRRSMVSEWVLSDARKPRSLEVDKAMIVFDPPPTLIRDGPSRRQQRLGDLLTDQDHKAA